MAASSTKTRGGSAAVRRSATAKATPTNSNAHARLRQLSERFGECLDAKVLEFEEDYANHAAWMAELLQECKKRAKGSGQALGLPETPSANKRRAAQLGRSVAASPALGLFPRSIPSTPRSNVTIHVPTSAAKQPQPIAAASATTTTETPAAKPAQIPAKPKSKAVEPKGTSKAAAAAAIPDLPLPATVVDPASLAWRFDTEIMQGKLAAFLSERGERCHAKLQPVVGTDLQQMEEELTEEPAAAAQPPSKSAAVDDYAAIMVKAQQQQQAAAAVSSMMAHPRIVTYSRLGAARKIQTQTMQAKAAAAAAAPELSSQIPVSKKQQAAKGQPESSDDLKEKTSQEADDLLLQQTDSADENCPSSKTSSAASQHSEMEQVVEETPQHRAGQVGAAFAFEEEEDGELPPMAALKDVSPAELAATGSKSRRSSSSSARRASPPLHAATKNSLDGSSSFSSSTVHPTSTSPRAALPIPEVDDRQDLTTLNSSSPTTRSSTSSTAAVRLSKSRTSLTSHLSSAAPEANAAASSVQSSFSEKTSAAAAKSQHEAVTGKEKAGDKSHEAMNRKKENSMDTVGDHLSPVEDEEKREEEEKEEQEDSHDASLDSMDLNVNHDSFDVLDTFSPSLKASSATESRTAAVEGVATASQPEALPQSNSSGRRKEEADDDDDAELSLDEPFPPSGHSTPLPSQRTSRMNQLHLEASALEPSPPTTSSEPTGGPKSAQESTHAHAWAQVGPELDLSAAELDLDADTSVTNFLLSPSRSPAVANPTRQPQSSTSAARGTALSSPASRARAATAASMLHGPSKLHPTPSSKKESSPSEDESSIQKRDLLDSSVASVDKETPSNVSTHSATSVHRSAGGAKVASRVPGYSKSSTATATASSSGSSVRAGPSSSARARANAAASAAVEAAAAAAASAAAQERAKELEKRRLARMEAQKASMAERDRMNVRGGGPGKSTATMTTTATAATATSAANAAAIGNVSSSSNATSTSSSGSNSATNAPTSESMNADVKVQLEEVQNIRRSSYKDFSKKVSPQRGEEKASAAKQPSVTKLPRPTASPALKESHRTTSKASLMASSSSSAAAPVRLGDPKLDSSPYQSYPMSPYTELDSDDEDESFEASRERKRVPRWAQYNNVQTQLRKQRHVDPERVFSLAQHEPTPDLSKIFGAQKDRFTYRKDSGNWTRDRLTPEELCAYKKRMGYLKSPSASGKQ